jgi:trk system potassium uptake protein TrkA
VTVGDLVRLLSFRHGEAGLVEITLPPDAPIAGHRVGSVAWPNDVALVAILRDTHVIVPSADDPLEAGDELLFVAAPDKEHELHDLVARGG